MATVLYLRTGSSDISRGRNDADKLGNTTPWSAFQLSEQIGTGANTSIQISTVAGPTNGLTLGVGAVDYEWLSPPILEVRNTSNNVTTQLLGKITSSMYAIESGNGVNAGIGVKLEVVDRSGSIKTGTYVDTVSAEIGTANTAVRQFVTQVGSGPTIEKGDRLRVQMYVADSGGTLSAGTVTFFYDGTTANFGSSRLTFEDTITFQTPTAVKIQNGYVETGITASTALNSFGATTATNTSGSIIVVGAPYASPAGAVYVKSGSNYSIETKLTASDAQINSNFGYSVACSQDGSIIVVGANFAKKDMGGLNTGKVYVYSGPNWSTETMITASDAADSDFFGSSVACSGNGSIIVVGAPSAEDPGTTDSGKVYVYSGTNYTTERMITASSPVSDDQFGVSVNCSKDGSVIVVGVQQYNYSLGDRGKVHVYSGTNYSTEQIITSSEIGYGDIFGVVTACSDDASVIFVSAVRENGKAVNSGKVYVYSGTNYKTETKITASDGTTGDYFGASLACSQDGSIIVVGADLKNTNSGKAYVYSGTNYTNEIAIVPSDPQQQARFGHAAACSQDASVIVIGAIYKEVSGVADAGKAYVYNISNTAFLTNLANNIGTNGKHAWYDRGNTFAATGGVETIITASGVFYKVHTFTASGDFTVTQPGTVEYLIVGGGGAGGTGEDRSSGGGGGGGVISGSRTLSTAGTRAIVVGLGGTSNSNGNLSSFDGLIASGGGFGGYYETGVTFPNGYRSGNSGSSGGGAQHNFRSLAGSGITGQGNNGGTGYDSGNTALMFAAGGGGGASQTGQNASTSATGRAGAGGSGSLSSINGTATYYGGGGGGGAQFGSSATSYLGGLGGPGGGGSGSATNVTAGSANAGQAGQANTGGGGGGGSGTDVIANVVGGNGGSGIVIIRYQL